MPKRWNRLPTDTDDAPVFTVADYYRQKLSRIPLDLTPPTDAEFRRRALINPE